MIEEESEVEGDGVRRTAQVLPDSGGGLAAELHEHQAPVLNATKEDPDSKTPLCSPNTFPHRLEKPTEYGSLTSSRKPIPYVAMEEENEVEGSGVYFTAKVGPDGGEG